jgi:hypothetical protein
MLSLTKEGSKDGCGYTCVFFRKKIKNVRDKNT